MLNKFEQNLFIQPHFNAKKINFTVKMKTNVFQEDGCAMVILIAEMEWMKNHVKV